MLDTTQTGRLIVILVILVAAALWGRSALIDRRRRARFAVLAESFGGSVIRDGEFRSRFPAEVEGRSFEIRDEHIGGRSKGYFLTSSTQLAGKAWKMHEVEIQSGAMRRKVLDTLKQSTVRSGDDAFDQRFSVAETGVPVRSGWLDANIRKAIAHFYDCPLPVRRLVVEAGSLIHRVPAPWKRFDPAALRELLIRQAGVAEALEQTGSSAKS